MSSRRRHHWTRRILLGLAFAVVVAPAEARPTASAGPELGLQQPQTKQLRVISYLSHGLTAADALDPRTVGLGQASPDAVERAVARTPDGAPVRPDDRFDRFAVGDVPPPAAVADGAGFSIDRENGLTFGIGGLALVLALGLAVAYLRRQPRIAFRGLM